MGTVRISFGFFIGCLFIASFVGYFFCNSRHITPVVEYISNEELMHLEKERMKLISDPNERQLYFGRVNDAETLIIEYIEMSQNKNNIIVLSNSKVIGKDVRSISNEAYEYVIRELGAR